MIDKIKDKLEKTLKRTAQEHEIINAQNDVNVMLSIVLDEINAINERLSIIEKKK